MTLYPLISGDRLYLTPKGNAVCNGRHQPEPEEIRNGQDS